MDTTASKASVSNDDSLKKTDSQITSLDQITKLEKLIDSKKLPEGLHDNVSAMVSRLKLISKESNFFAEYDTISRYINWAVSIPWDHPSQDVLNLSYAKRVLDKNHYGLQNLKEEILEFISIMILTKAREGKVESIQARAPQIALIGLVGTGKTTISKSIAEAMGRKFVRIPFGGMGAANQLRGRSRMQPDSEPGMIIKALKRAGTSNPVLLLDEIDRVSDEARADIMGVLIELLDPGQNNQFVDHYIDYPVDLSQVLFIATANNTKNLSTAVADRLQIIQMPSYTDEEKIHIAKHFIFPQALSESGLVPEELAVDDSVWVDIVRPLGYDAGVRSLQRAIKSMVRKIVYHLLIGKISHGKQFTITRENMKMYLPL